MRIFNIATLGLTAALLVTPTMAQSDRGKASMKAGAGAITIDYGRPSSPSRDRVEELRVGDTWRLGKDAATVLTTPADLSFGPTKIAKGSYSLFLRRTSADQFELVVNSQTGQWGTVHDPAKDIAKIPLKKESLDNLTETFTIELKEGQGGGTFAMAWGKTRLSSAFTIK